MSEQDQQNKIQEMQFLEQNLQNLMFQKQAFQMELSETQSALEEVEKSNGEVFKVIGQMMIKTEKNKMNEDLSNKKKLMDLRVSAIEKQETSLNEKLEKLREEVLKSMKK